MKVFNIYKKFSTFTRFLAFSFLLGLVVSVSVFSLIPMFASAIFAPGSTLDPDCLPTDPTCTVSANWTSAISASNFTGTSTGINTGDIILTNSSNGLTLSGQTLTLGLAGASATGTLSATDWNTFNNKLSSYTESDPVWNLASSSYLSTTTASSTYAALSGATFTGPISATNINGLTLSANNIDFNTLIGKDAGLNLVTGAQYNTFLGYEAGLSSSSASTDVADKNVGIGYQSLYSNTTGSANTANGYSSLYSNTTGSGNNANGYMSLYSNTTGVNNTGNGQSTLTLNTTGDWNTANGAVSLYSNTTGSNNTANGVFSLYSNTTGSKNTASGVNSLYSNTTGDNNTANGLNSLYSNTTGIDNSAIGMNSLFSNTTGSYNTANGMEALKFNTTGGNNTANGYTALYSNTTGNGNTANGFNSLFYNTTGNNNTANGNSSLILNTTGSNNTANGGISLYSNTTGSNNTANGVFSLYANTTGGANTASGVNSLHDNTTGSDNTANGTNALYTNTTGIDNTANGSGALTFNTTGSYNTANGMDSLRSNTTGIDNTANGYTALYSNTTGNSNTANGFNALYYNTTGTANTANGSGALLANTTGSLNTANGAGALSTNTTGSGNTANGVQALLANTTGGDNTANGASALSTNTTGSQNTANGTLSLYSNTTGNNNTANGFYSLVFNTTGSNNTANGVSSLNSNTTGINNVANGFQSLYSNTDGYSNVANGAYSLFSNTTGNNNTANGSWALTSNGIGGLNTANGVYSLYSNTSGYGNTAIGYNSLASNSTGSGNVALGYFAGMYETGSNSFYVDSFDRANLALGKAGALLYGTFNSTSSDQTLTINASTTIAQNLTVFGIGTSTFSGYLSSLNLSGLNTGDETTNSIKTKLNSASSTADGYLTSTDWNTFNNKQAAGSYLTFFTETDPIWSAASSSYLLIATATSTYAPISNILALNNVTAFTPTADYHPATKKYVDDLIAGLNLGTSSSSGGLSLTTITASGTAQVGRLYINTGASADFTMNLPTSTPDGSTIGFMNVTGGGGIDGYTKLNLHLNNNVTDSSASTHTITNSNVAFTNTSGQYKFDYSALFNGINAKLTSDTSNDFNLYGSDWTVDFWLYLNSVSTGRRILSFETSGGATSGIYLSATDKIAFGNFGVDEQHSSASLSVSTLYHIAFVRSGGVLKLYINGVLDSTYSTYEPFSNVGNRFLTVGQSTNFPNGWLDGTIDELRISKGIARWTSNFTPPLSSYGAGATVVVSPAFTESIYPYATGTPIILSNQGAKLSLIKNNGKWYDASFGIGGGGTLTIPSLTGNTGKYLTTDGSNLSWADASGISGNGLTLTTITASGTAAVGNLYTNLGATADYTMTLPSGSVDGSTIGFLNTAGTGGIDSSTKLMLHMDGNLTDSSASAYSVTDHSTTNDSTNKVFGSASRAFNGTSAYLSLADSEDWNVGSGDFTVDFRVRFNTVKTTMFFGQWSVAPQLGPMMYYNTADGKLSFYWSVDGSNSSNVNAPVSFNTGTWYHIAVVRNGTALSVYLDGTQIANTTTSDVINNSASNLTIGSDGIGNSFLAGNIDEFRWSKGTARWTSNFTPPSEEYFSAKLITVTPASSESIYPYSADTPVTLSTEGSKLSLIKNNGKWYDAAFGIGGGSTASSTPITSATTFAVGTTTSLATLTVSGNSYFSDVFTVASTTGVSSILGKLSIGTSTSLATLTIAGDLSLSGKIFDTNYSPGTAGMVLQSTGTSTQWVSTSSLGISGGSSVPELVTITSGTTTIDSTYNGKLITNAGATESIILQLPSISSVGNNFEISVVNEVDGGEASGGNSISTDGSDTVRVFTSSSTFTTNVALSVEYLVVGAGGPGGTNGRGGGGGGQVATGTLSLAAGTYTVQIGSPYAFWSVVDGNPPPYSAGSIFSSVTANGGWQSGYPLGGQLYAPGGNAGAGPAPYNGTNGTVSSITGSSTYYAGGGGGNGATTGGLGGGGNGDSVGTPNTGGGGGGMTPNSGGYIGGSGLVILRHPTLIHNSISLIPAAGEQIPGTTAPDRILKSTGKNTVIKLRSTNTGWIAESVYPTASEWGDYNPSSRSVKENFTQLDKQDILNKIAKLDMTEWNYIAQDDGIKHIGPIAEDFYGLFGLGGTDKAISTIDPAGIALVGIQALNKNLQSIFGTTSIESLSNSTTTLETYTVTDLFAGMVKSALQKLSSTFIDTILSVRGMVIGSAEKPSGVTIYDQTTKEPYCLKMNNGTMVTSPGVCTDAAVETFTTSTASVIDSIPTESSSSNSTTTASSTNDSGQGETSTEATSTETITATTTEPVVEETASSTTETTISGEVTIPTEPTSTETEVTTPEPPATDSVVTPDSAPVADPVVTPDSTPTPDPTPAPDPTPDPTPPSETPVI